MKFIVFVSAVLAIATSAKAGVMRTPEDTRPVVIGDGSSTPRHEIAGPSTPFTGVAGASTPLIEVPTVEDIPEVVEVAGVPKVVQIDEEPSELVSMAKMDNSGSPYFRIGHNCDYFLLDRFFNKMIQ